MPNVNGKKFPYTKEGKDAARKMAAKQGAVAKMKDKKKSSY